MIQSSYFVIESHIVYEYLLSYSHNLKPKNLKAFVFQFFSTLYLYQRSEKYRFNIQSMKLEMQLTVK